MSKKRERKGRRAADPPTPLPRKGGGKKRAAAPDPVTAYARDVVAGKYVVGRLVRMACERHLRDLESGEARGLWFDAAEARAALDFWRLCPHVKGRKWAGTTIDPRPWQEFIVGSVFGWKKRTPDGWVRRFRIAWVEIGRKNGKSTLAYPAGLYGLTVDGEPGAEVYSLATKKDQARIVYQLARRAVLKVPEFAAVVTPYRDSLTVEADGSKFEALGADADTLDGLNPSVVIADEIHKWRGRELWDVIDNATGARDQPLILVITTAGQEGEEDVYGQEHAYTEQVLEGVIEDDGRFGYIACLDPGDDWTDPKNVEKANPNLGVSVMLEEIVAMIRRAVKSPAAANGVKRTRLGIRTQDEDAAIPLPAWDACRADVDPSKFRGAACGAGLDLASTSDFAAFAQCFPIDADLAPAADFARPWGYLFRWRLWIPREFKTQSEGKLRDLVRPWAPRWAEFTDGDVIDLDLIEAEVKAECGRADVRRLCYDPWNATTVALHLQDAGVPVEQFKQAMGTFAEPTKKYLEAVAGGRLRHDGNPCARWMANNLVVMTNGVGHRMPARKKSRNKIDGQVAAIMALGAVLAPTESGTISPHLMVL